MDEDLRAYPFLYMNGHGTVRLAPEEIDRLREYLEAGGFLHADDNYGMDASFRELVRELFPEKELEELPNYASRYTTFSTIFPGSPRSTSTTENRRRGSGSRSTGGSCFSTRTNRISGTGSRTNASTTTRRRSGNWPRGWR